MVHSERIPIPYEKQYKQIFRYGFDAGGRNLPVASERGCIVMFIEVYLK